jgi:hypothetical protein
MRFTLPLVAASAAAIATAAPAAASGIFFPPAGSNSFAQLYEIDSGQHICQPLCAQSSSFSASTTLGPFSLTAPNNVSTVSGLASTDAASLHAFLTGNTAMEFDVAMNDTYTVHGGSGPFAITATMLVDGTMSTIPLGNTGNNILLGGGVIATIGQFDINPAEVFQPIVLAFDPTTQARTGGVTLVGAPQSVPVNLTASYTRMVNPGDVFDIGYEISLGYAEGTIDLSHTAAISFDLPDGVFLTDAFGNTFGAPPTGPGVPEPASWALMITGFALAGAALRSKRTLLQTRS